MDDGSSKSIVMSLKNEWSLFWESITGDNVPADAFETGKLEVLTPAQLQEITRSLSQDRKRIHQKIETLNKELDLNAIKLESLRLVGGPEDDTLRRIVELNDIGQFLSDQLQKLDEKIKATR